MFNKVYLHVSRFRVSSREGLVLKIVTDVYAYNYWGTNSPRERAPTSTMNNLLLSISVVILLACCTEVWSLAVWLSLSHKVIQAIRYSRTILQSVDVTNWGNSSLQSFWHVHTRCHIRFNFATESLIHETKISRKLFRNDLFLSYSVVLKLWIEFGSQTSPGNCTWRDRWTIFLF